METSNLAYRDAEAKPGAVDQRTDRLEHLAEAVIHRFLAERVKKVVLEDILDHAYTEPLRDFARKRGISPTKVYKWIEEGLLLSFLEGDRRHVVVSSYGRLVRQRIAEQQGGSYLSKAGRTIVRLRERSLKPLCGSHRLPNRTASRIVWKIVRQIRSFDHFQELALLVPVEALKAG
jgi:hypothetical protein